jgi:hypothetical protein
MKLFQILEIDKQTYVLTHRDRMPLMQNANFRNTGMALCGKLKKGQTIEQFKEQYNAKKPTKKQKETV